MASFDAAIQYVIDNEGGWTNDPADRGGRTMYGITEEEAKRHGLSVESITLDQAKAIYRARYWNELGLDEVRDQRVATKLLDMAVNIGPKMAVKILQRALGVVVDGVFGNETRNKLVTAPADFWERLTTCLVDYYVEIVRLNYSQIVFLRGWLHRAIRRPR